MYLCIKRNCSEFSSRTSAILLLNVPDLHTVRTAFGSFFFESMTFIIDF